jgi:hypothetical protein
MRKLLYTFNVLVICLSGFVFLTPLARNELIFSMIRFCCVVIGISWFFRARKLGLLKMTVSETYRSASMRPQASFVDAIAIVVSLIALSIPWNH